MVAVAWPEEGRSVTGDERGGRRRSAAVGNAYAGHGRTNGWSLRVPTAMLSTIGMSPGPNGHRTAAGDERVRRRVWELEKIGARAS